MARIRTIKPEFWTSEQIVNCSIPARLLFIGLWNFCDDAGIHPASSQRLKMEVFPGDSMTTEEIDKLISELLTQKLLIKYKVEEKTYWQVTGWHHQKIDKPNQKYPLPNTPLLLSESSPTSRQPVDELSTIPRLSKRKGKGKDIEEDICQVASATQSVSSENSTTSKVQEIFLHWQKTLNHPKAKLDSARQKKIEQALKLGYSVDDLKQAIDGCGKTSFNMGENDRKQRYDDLGLILRDSDHIERFMKATTRTSCPPNLIDAVYSVPKPSEELFRGAI